MQLPATPIGRINAYAAWFGFLTPKIPKKKHSGVVTNRAEWAVVKRGIAYSSPEPDRVNV